jgi:Flp pilus assembly protein TadG
MLRKRASLRSERGQTMVEFTIVLPIFLMLVLGVAQLGVAFNNYITITDAARAGARQGAVSRTLPDPTGATTSRVRSSAANLDQAKLTVSVASPWTQGSDVTVTANYPYSINLLGLVVKSGQLSSSTTERVE